MNTTDHVVKLLKIVAKHFHMSQDELFNKTRDVRTIQARAAATKVLRDIMTLSYPQLAIVFKQTHGASHNAYKRANEWLRTDRNFRRSFVALESELRKRGEL